MSDYLEGVSRGGWSDIAFLASRGKETWGEGGLGRGRVAWRFLLVGRTAPERVWQMTCLAFRGEEKDTILTFLGQGVKISTGARNRSLATNGALPPAPLCSVTVSLQNIVFRASPSWANRYSGASSFNPPLPPCFPFRHCGDARVHVPKDYDHARYDHTPQQ